MFAEEEVEYNLRNVIVNVETTLSASTFSWGSPELVFWRSPLYDIKVAFYFCWRSVESKLSQ